MKGVEHRTPTSLRMAHAILEIMLHGIPAWAADLAWVSEGDQTLPSTIDGINVVLNRARLAAYLSDFGDDKDVRDLLLLDLLANAAALPLSSTGAPELVPSLALRPFRLWEYMWLFKALGLGKGRAKILDLGGPATHLTILAALAGCSVTSIDINPDFVRSAQGCAEVLGLPSFESRVGDMRDLSDFDDESFDVVLSCSVLEHLTAKDQESALEEMARVLRRGGLIGLTFDYGPPAPGANEYLPPPHDPPGSAAEATRRYVRGGLQLVGNPFVEDPTPGALFINEHVRYTVASLFLAKAPIPDIPFPRCECQGSSLGSLVISKLPFRMHESVARNMALLESAGSPSEGESYHGSGAAPYHGNGLGEARIMELERMAEERLASLNTVHEHMEALRGEADARERGLHELTSVIAARDARIAGLEQMAEERLSKLNTVHEHMEALRAEADARERGLHELAAVIAARDARIVDLEQMAEARLSKLNTVHEHMEALRGEADAQERDLNELASAIAARDASVAELERLAEERLAQISEIQHTLTEAIAKQEVLSTQILALKCESLLEYLTRRLHKA